MKERNTGMKYDAQLFELVKKEEIAPGIFDFHLKNNIYLKINGRSYFKKGRLTDQKISRKGECYETDRHKRLTRNE